MLDELKENIEKKEIPDYSFIEFLCVVFGDAFSTLVGLGGTRIVISKPSNNSVLKFAYNELGIEGNLDEFVIYEEAPTSLKDKLGKVNGIFENGLILEMEYYKPIEEDDFIFYQNELNKLYNLVEFIYYQDPPYFHSFGTDSDGKLILIDYGETEKISFK
jgi:hypothetical protein